MSKYAVSGWKLAVVVILLLLSVALNMKFIFSRPVSIALIPVSTPVSAPLFLLTVSTPTPAPFIKQDILINMQAGKGLDIWIDNIDTHIVSVAEVEGVMDVIKSYGGYALYVRVDPRYDKDVVAGEILEMLTSKVVTNVW